MAEEAIGFTPDGERTWLRATYQHLMEARAAAHNFMAHNLDGQESTFALLDTIEKAIEQTKILCNERNILLSER